MMRKLGRQVVAVALAAGGSWACSAGVPESASSVLASTSPEIVLPVLVHYKESSIWTSPESLRGVFAEAQRIYDQAGIKLEITISDQMTEDKHQLDVHFVNHPVGYCGYWNLNDGWGYREIRVYDGCFNGLEPHPTEVAVARGWPGEGVGSTVKLTDKETAVGIATAHEIGHALGLGHVSDNSLMDGASYWHMWDYQITTARSNAMASFARPDCLIGEIKVGPEFSSTGRICAVWVKGSDRVFTPYTRDVEQCDTAALDKLKQQHAQCRSFTVHD